MGREVEGCTEGEGKKAWEIGRDGKGMKGEEGREKERGGQDPLDSPPEKNIISYSYATERITVA